MFFFRESCISSLDLSALFWPTMHILVLEKVSYCISPLFILNHLILAIKHIHTFLLNVNRVAYFILIQISITLKLIYIIYVLIEIPIEINILKYMV